MKKQHYRRSLVRQVYLRSLFQPLVLAGAVFLAAPELAAQNVDSLRASYLVPLPPSVEASRTAIRSSPGSSSGTPTAYGAEWGDLFLGAGFQARVRYSPRSDGAVAGGFGLGNPRRTLGIEGVITSYSTFRSGFFNHTSFSFKVHRALPWNLAVASGWENWIRSEGLDGGSSMYGVVSAYIPIRETEGATFRSVIVSAGVGGGRFQTERAIEDRRHGANVFGSIGVRILSPVSLIADWTGQDLTLGASIVPFVKLPLYITPAFADVTGTAGDGARLILGVGLDFRFLER